LEGYSIVVLSRCSDYWCSRCIGGFMHSARDVGTI